MNFNIVAFILAFSVGMLIVYCFTPFPEVVVKYPRPNDYHSYRYQKDNGICMEYEMKEVSCPADKKSKTINENEEKDTSVLQG